MIDDEDLKNFKEFSEKQLAVLKEKGEDKYKDESWKDLTEDDIFDEMEDQLYSIEDSDDNEYIQRRLLHIANYAFFLHELLKK